MTNQKRTRWFPHSSFQLALLIGVVVLINLLLFNVSARVDLTEDKQFTLSDASKSLVGALSDPLTIKVFISKEVPQDMLALKQDVADLVSEYERAGNGNVILESIDPKQDAAAQKDVTAYGIPEIQFNVVGKEKFEVSTGYAGIALLHGDTREVIPVITQTDNLEYDLTAAIQKMTRTEIPTISFLSDHGTQSSQQLQTYLSQQYTTEEVTIDQLNEVKHLVMIGPTEEFTDTDRYAVDQVLMRGGTVFALLNGMTVDEQAGTVTPESTKLNELLSAYGVQMQANIVGDFGSPETLQFGRGAFTVLQPYPLWPRVTNETVDQKHPITSTIQSITFPWASAVSVEYREGIHVTELVKTTPRSKAFEQLLSIQPDTLPTPTTEEFSQQTLSVLLTGAFTSAYEGKTLPAEVSADGFIARTGEGKLFVAGNARFVSDELLGQSIENGLLLVNAIDVLTQENNLVSIRSRSALSRPIEALSDQQKVTIKYLNIFSSVVLVVLAALITHIIRRRRDRVALHTYGSL